MKSPLEDNPKLLEKIGLFIVLFNGIDNRLSLEFLFMISQTDPKNKDILNFLATQDFKRRLDILKVGLGQELYELMEELNKFRTYIAHSTYGKKLGFPDEEIYMTKLTKSGNFDSQPLDEQIMDEHIQK